MNLIGAVIGGTIGALIGGAIWVVVGYALHVQIGWIAWGVGALAGVGAAVGSKGEGGVAAGLIAVVLAIGSILLAKYVVVQLMVDHYIKTHPFNAASDVPAIDVEPYWIGRIADHLAAERKEAGKAVNWPAGKDAESAEFEADYPKDLWADAKKRFKAMSLQDKEDYRRDRIEALEEMSKFVMETTKSTLYKERFYASFRVFDIIFGMLAICTAFKVGSGETAES